MLSSSWSIMLALRRGPLRGVLMAYIVSLTMSMVPLVRGSTTSTDGLRFRTGGVAWTPSFARFGDEGDDHPEQRDYHPATTRRHQHPEEGDLSATNGNIQASTTSTSTATYLPQMILDAGEDEDHRSEVYDVPRAGAVGEEPGRSNPRSPSSRPPGDAAPTGENRLSGGSTVEHFSLASGDTTPHSVSSDSSPRGRNDVLPSTADDLDHPPSGDYNRAFEPFSLRPPLSPAHSDIPVLYYDGGGAAISPIAGGSSTTSTSSTEVLHRSGQPSGPGFLRDLYGGAPAPTGPALPAELSRGTALPVRPTELSTPLPVRPAELSTPRGSLATTRSSFAATEDDGGPGPLFDDEFLYEDLLGGGGQDEYHELLDLILDEQEMGGGEDSGSVGSGSGSPSRSSGGLGGSTGEPILSRTATPMGSEVAMLDGSAGGTPEEEGGGTPGTGIFSPAEEVEEDPAVLLAGTTDKDSVAAFDEDCCSTCTGGTSPTNRFRTWERGGSCFRTWEDVLRAQQNAAARAADAVSTPSPQLLMHRGRREVGPASRESGEEAPEQPLQSASASTTAIVPYNINSPRSLSCETTSLVQDARNLLWNLAFARCLEDEFERFEKHKRTTQTLPRGWTLLDKRVVFAGRTPSSEETHDELGVCQTAAQLRLLALQQACLLDRWRSSTSSQTSLHDACGILKQNLSLSEQEMLMPLLCGGVAGESSASGTAPVSGVVQRRTKRGLFVLQGFRGSGGADDDDASARGDDDAESAKGPASPAASKSFGASARANESFCWPSCLTSRNKPRRRGAVVQLYNPHQRNSLAVGSTPARSARAPADHCSSWDYLLNFITSCCGMTSRQNQKAALLGTMGRKIKKKVASFMEDETLDNCCCIAWRTSSSVDGPPQVYNEMLDQAVLFWTVFTQQSIQLSHRSSERRRSARGGGPSPRRRSEFQVPSAL